MTVDLSNLTVFERFQNKMTTLQILLVLIFHPKGTNVPKVSNFEVNQKPEFPVHSRTTKTHRKKGTTNSMIFNKTMLYILVDIAYIISSCIYIDFACKFKHRKNTSLDARKLRMQKKKKT